MGLMEKIRESVRTWLQITEPTAGLISITPTLDFYGNASKNRIWYRGDSEELSQLYGQLPGDRTRFWAATSTPGLEIRKIHTGIPGLMVDMLSAISIAKYHTDISDDNAVAELWEAIEDDNSFRDILEQAVKDCLVVGDGAFKISFDQSLSDYPIIEWYAGDSVDFVTDRGRIREIVFKTPIQMLRFVYGDDDADALLDALGIAEMGRDELMLKPEILDIERAKRGEPPLTRLK